MIPDPDSGLAPVSIDTRVLDADPSSIADAADAWAAFADATRTAAKGPEHAAALQISDGWAGDACDSYQDHVASLGSDMADAATAADAAAGSLRLMAHSLASTKNALLDSLFALKAAGMSGVSSGDTMTFTPENSDQLKAASDAKAEADDRAGHLEDVLTHESIKMGNNVTALEDASARWKNLARLGTPGWAVPQESKTPTLVHTGAGIFIDAGASNNNVEISDDASGEDIVTIDGTPYYLPSSEPLTVSGGAGKDTILVADGTKSDFTLIGGQGDDLLGGGAGDNVIYDELGNDTTEAGSGREYDEGNPEPGLPPSTGGAPSDKASGPANGGAGDAGTSASSAMVDGVGGDETPHAVRDTAPAPSAG